MKRTLPLLGMLLVWQIVPLLVRGNSGTDECQSECAGKCHLLKMQLHISHAQSSDVYCFAGSEIL